MERRARDALERVGFVVTGRGQQHDRIVLKAAGDEAEHADRGRIQPLHVLGHHQQRLPGGRVREQVQGRHGQRERLRRGSCGDAEGDPQSGLPRLGDQVGQGQQRPQQLIEPGHGQARLRRAAERPQDPPARAGPPDRLLDQRRLADAGRSSDHDRGAALPVGQDGGDQAQLGVPADENAAVNNAPHSRHSYRVSHRGRGCRGQTATAVSGPELPRRSARGRSSSAQITAAPRKMPAATWKPTL